MTRRVSEGFPFMEGKIDMAARRQVTNKLRDPYRKGSARWGPAPARCHRNLTEAFGTSCLLNVEAGGAHAAGVVWPC